MFYVPKEAIHKKVSRRDFLKMGGGAATALGAGSIALGLSSVINRRPVYAQSSDAAKWKQYEGSKMFSALLVDSGGPLPLLREELKGLVAKLSSDFGGNERVKRRKTALKWPIQKGDLQKMVAGIEKHQNALVLGLSVENL